ncbi:helix-turn-helix domain-containing protein [Paraclostridium tenue]|uniref:HTH cro/C1-type domain-containing protein n=1 Tax=Paraclostridium tenue TaxID=1737 RepID=A0ABN1M9E8_9FIRM
MNNRIREVRKDKNLTQKQLGALLGLTRDSITSIENCRVVPNELFINHFCDKLKVNKEWLVNGIGDKYFSTSEEENILADIFASLTVNEAPKLKKLILELNELDDDHLDLIENLAKGLKQLQKKEK